MHLSDELMKGAMEYHTLHTHTAVLGSFRMSNGALGLGLPPAAFVARKLFFDGTEPPASIYYYCLLALSIARTNVDCLLLVPLGCMLRSGPW